MGRSTACSLLQGLVWAPGVDPQGTEPSAGVLRPPCLPCRYLALRFGRRPTPCLHFSPQWRGALRPPARWPGWGTGLDGAARAALGEQVNSCSSALSPSSACVRRRPGLSFLLLPGCPGPDPKQTPCTPSLPHPPVPFGIWWPSNRRTFHPQLRLPSSQQERQYVLEPAGPERWLQRAPSSCCPVPTALRLPVFLPWGELMTPGNLCCQ